MLTPADPICSCLLLALFCAVLFTLCPLELGVTAAGCVFTSIGGGGATGGFGGGGGGGAGGNGGGAGTGGGGAGAEPPPPKHIVLFL